MSDPVLRELTASEPLTLEEEYEMQRKLLEHSELSNPEFEETTINRKMAD